MADTILKRWNGTSWEEVNPQTTHTQIVASGTPSSTTYLRGDGTWATISAGSTFTGGTITGNIEISNTLPKITLTDTDHNSDFNIANNNGVFTIGDTTNQTDRFKIYSSGDLEITGSSIDIEGVTLLNDSGALKWDGTAISLAGHTHTFASLTSKPTTLAGYGITDAYSSSNPSGYQTATQVATTVSNLVASAPATLDTLNELAAALGDDPNFATTVSTNIGTKLSLTGGTMTGPLTMTDSGDPIYLNRIGSRGTEIYIGAGESLASITGTAEQVYIAGESGVSVHASSDNLTSGLNRSAQLIDTSGNASWGSGSITAGTFIGALSGNASTATTWQTARTLTVGNTGKSVNGSGNVSWSLAEIGAYAASNPSGYTTYSANQAVNTTSSPTFSTLYSTSYYINNTDTRLMEGGGNALRMQTSTGYIDMGSMNGSWAHFETDRARFYFGKPVSINGGLQDYSTGSNYWHASNDGSGSGLDADLLDGQHASSFASSSHTHNLLVYNLAPTSVVDGMTNTTFRSSMFGTSANGNQIATARWNVSPSVLGMSSYGTLIGWGASDTQGFLAVDYNTQRAKVGGGNGNLINWVQELIHAGNIGSQSVSNANTVDGYHIVYGSTGSDTSTLYFVP
jgi:hypothetical protein